VNWRHCSCQYDVILCKYVSKYREYTKSNKQCNSSEATHYVRWQGKSLLQQPHATSNITSDCRCNSNIGDGSNTKVVAPQIATWKLVYVSFSQLHPRENENEAKTITWRNCHVFAKQKS